MKRSLFVVALLTAIQSHASTLDTGGKDVFDRPVAPLVSNGLPTMLLYANKGTKDALQGPATEMAVRLHDAPFVTLVHVDLRDIPGLFRGIARGKIRSSQRDGVARYVEAFRAKGFEPPEDAFNRLVFIADNDGAPHQALGLNRGFSEAIAIVYDAQGQEIGRGFFPRDLDRIEQALRGCVGTEARGGEIDSASCRATLGIRSSIGSSRTSGRSRSSSCWRSCSRRRVGV